MDTVGISAIQLADYLGVSRGHIYELKKGKSAPSAQLMEKLAGMETPLGKLNLHWFITGEGEMFQIPITPETPKIKMIFDMIGSELDGIIERLQEIEEKQAEVSEFRRRLEELEKR